MLVKYKRRFDKVIVICSYVRGPSGSKMDYAGLTESGLVGLETTVLGNKPQKATGLASPASHSANRLPYPQSIKYCV